MHVFAFLIFGIAFAASIWAIWTTVAPRLPYIRSLLLGEAAPLLVEERDQDTIIRIERRAR